ncbi:hypothetical protein GGR26_000406 [Lewinella marina]|uniref:Glycosyltransferase RgtA/B/C/D-like domain-containing protein n=1 Tax=Neolewinella marina TaxID=438751 RepID=A0A2G0CJM2_9BACT|nr:hypothetical protein [Neolewinella marina]NJB84661.1 hypothetical protein [Neolewinella marina]PHL00166.1 hypothetical protein CGL56_03755 [Neolewinella marina]
MKPTYRWLAWIALLGFILADLAHSGLQYYHQPLDGDVAWNLVPAREVEPILNDPFGIQTWRDGRSYPNPNRFFCHWTYRTYFLGAPRLLQAVVDPVTSVYLAGALARLAVHLALLLLLARTVLGHWRFGSLSFMAVLALLTPFFQANGYRHDLGIIDPSVTYTFFYALPSAALLLFLLPFFDLFFHRKPPKTGWHRTLAWAGLAVFVCLSGPLNPAVILVITATAGPLWFIRILRREWRPVPQAYYLWWGWATALALYSLYVGSFNSLTIANELPLTELYARWPRGVFLQFTRKLAWPVLFFSLGIIYVLLGRGGDGARRTRQLFPWVGLFCLLYLLLLPLGGYRSYREFILRYDTILPVTLAAILVYAAGIHRLLADGKDSRRWWLLGLPLGVGLIFTLADRPDFQLQRCEEAALRTLAASTRDTVALPADCPVLSWETFTDPAWSEQNARLLRAWGIVDRPLLYHHSR